MQSKLQGDVGNLKEVKFIMLEDGEAILDVDGVLRLRIDHNSYLARSTGGMTTAHTAKEWPSTVTGKKLKIRLIMEAIQ